MLKEVNSTALASCREPEQVVEALAYVVRGDMPVRDSFVPYIDRENKPASCEYEKDREQAPVGLATAHSHSLSLSLSLPLEHSNNPHHTTPEPAIKNDGLPRAGCNQARS